MFWEVSAISHTSCPTGGQLGHWPEQQNDVAFSTIQCVPLLPRLSLVVSLPLYLIVNGWLYDGWGFRKGHARDDAAGQALQHIRRQTPLSDSTDGVDNVSDFDF
jgi:hypothetical protein